MNKDIFKGFILAFIVLGFFGTLAAVGFHSANEILSGTFLGNYSFEGEVNLNNELVLANYSIKPSCQLSNKGSLIYDDVNGKPFVCNATNWKPLDSDFDSDGITDWLDADDENETLLHGNLTPENIVKGVIIFGINGTSEMGIVEYDPGVIECEAAFDYQGVSYSGVQVGTQCWMDKNLQYNVANSRSVAGSPVSDGRLYNYATAVGYSGNDNSHESVQGICPSGWHVPSQGDWNTLRQYLAGSNYCNLDGTSCVPSGYRIAEGGNAHLNLPLIATESYNTINAVWSTGTRNQTGLYLTSTWLPVDGGVYGIGGYARFSYTKNEPYTVIAGAHKIYDQYLPLRCIRD